MPESPTESPTESSPDSPTNSPPSGWSWPNFFRNAAIIATACALLGLGTWYYVKGVHPNLFPKNFGAVVEGVLYRSGELTPAATEKVVRAHGIRTIVDLGAHDEGSPEERRAQATADALGVRRHRFFLVGDATGDPNRYVRALEVMTDPDAQPVLVHCAAGAQRTGCAIALYRDIVEGVDPEAAMAESRNYRHDPADNPHMPAMFWGVRELVRDSLETGEPIPYAPDRPIEDQYPATPTP